MVIKVLTYLVFFYSDDLGAHYFIFLGKFPKNILRTSVVLHGLFYPTRASIPRKKGMIKET